MNIWCKLFGHKIVDLDTKRFFANCSRCHKGLKVSYDMSYGDTVVTGDYGNQTCFVWCDCGNELCSNGDLVSDDIYVQYSCNKCGEPSTWDFDAPAPIRVDPVASRPTE